MEAGRELDERIHAEVMGWSKNYSPDPAIWSWKRDDWYMTRDQTPLYSTDIAAAWQVVERMREQGWRLELRPDYGRNYSHWEAILKQSVQAVTGAAPVAPHAICIAALRAVEN